MKLPRAFLSLCLCVTVLRAEGAELAVGDKVPEAEFISQDGKAVHLGDFKGQALAITFIFTRCPLPAYCPRMTARFAEAQQELQGPAAPAGPWHLLSLSFDPEHDTPEQLRAYAKAHAASLQHWTFATAKGEGVRRFGVQFGLTAVMEEGLLNHNLRTVVLDAAGRVQCIFKGNEWTAAQLVWEMRKAMPVEK